MFTSFVLARRSDTSKCFAQVHRKLFAPFAGHTQKVVERWRPYCGWVTRVTPKPSLLPCAEEYFCASGFFFFSTKLQNDLMGIHFLFESFPQSWQEEEEVEAPSDGVICIQWEKRFQVEGRAEKGRNLLTDLFRAKGTRLGGLNNYVRGEKYTNLQHVTALMILWNTPNLTFMNHYDRFPHYCEGRQQRWIHMFEKLIRHYGWPSNVKLL